MPTASGEVYLTWERPSISGPLASTAGGGDCYSLGYSAPGKLRVDHLVAKYAQTVGDSRSPGAAPRVHPLESARVVSRCGQPWWSVLRYVWLQSDEVAQTVTFSRNITELISIGCFCNEAQLKFIYRNVYRERTNALAIYVYRKL